jgi:hypothetical protein
LRRSLEKRRLQSTMSTPVKASYLLQTRITIRRGKAKQRNLIKSQFGWPIHLNHPLTVPFLYHTLRRWMILEYLPLIV